MFKLHYRPVNLKSTVDSRIFNKIPVYYASLQNSTYGDWAATPKILFAICPFLGFFNGSCKFFVVFDYLLPDKVVKEKIFQNYISSNCSICLIYRLKYCSHSINGSFQFDFPPVRSATRVGWESLGSTPSLRSLMLWPEWRCIWNRTETARGSLTWS